MKPMRAAGAAAYSRLGLESDVLSASPHRLITLLFDGADTAIRTAAVCLQDGDAAGRGKAISRALDIVNNGLLAALDHERGGEVAANLASLYDYVARQLLRANLHADAAALDEAGSLLREIASAWREIDAQRTEGAL